MNFSNFGSVMAKANKLKNDLTKKIAEFDEKEFTISYQNDAIVVKLKGSLKLLDLKINPTLIDPEDATTLQEMVIEAINHAMDQVTEQKNQITSAMMPKGFGNLF